jgi:hypothetical protein
MKFQSIDNLYANQRARNSKQEVKGLSSRSLFLPGYFWSRHLLQIAAAEHPLPEPTENIC